MNRTTSPSNAITVDVEDYFHGPGFGRFVPCEKWEQHPSRVERNTKKVLELLAEFDLRATFFVLGWVAERRPALVRELQAAGHDLGCHSYAHRLIYTMTPQEFRDDTRRACAAIEDASGARVHAYRAPMFSITSRSLWALEILLEFGFKVDSSIFPTRNHLYGIPSAPRQPFRIRIQGSDLAEFPLPALKMGIWGLPVTGGAYLRLLPYRLQMLGLNRMARRSEPIILYFHPWELDPDQPRLASGFGARIFQYTGLDRTEVRLRRLFRAFSFGKLPDSSDASSPVYTVAVGAASGRKRAALVPLSGR
jgi:polysaccharide deacetylase family protein (PEP-CTERM system associated)